MPLPFQIRASHISMQVSATRSFWPQELKAAVLSMDDLGGRREAACQDGSRHVHCSWKEDDLRLTYAAKIIRDK